MYIPEGVKNLKDMKYPQIRLGLQGKPATGKTRGALTFPNPVVLDVDNSLTEHAGKDIIVLPFWDDTYIAQYNNGKYKPVIKGARPKTRDAIKWFMENEAPKLEVGQTLIIDSWTSVQDAFDRQQVLEPKYTKGGGIDEFHFWAEKYDYSSALLSLCESLRCHVVITFHEHQARDKITGLPQDKFAPLMAGQFVAKIAKYFTDFFRTRVINSKAGVSYVWQARADGQFDAKSRLTKLPQDTIYIEPTFEVFARYGYNVAQ